MNKTNAEIARAALDLILATGGDMPTSPADPILDEAAALIEQGLKREGFVLELCQQASAAGIAFEAPGLTEALMAGARISLRNRPRSGE